MTGLTTAEATALLQKYGPNELQRAEKINPIFIFLGQFNGFLNWLLIGAAVLSFVLGEIADGTSILVILLINATIGFMQEFKAEKAVQALKKMTAPHCRVVRDGVAVMIASADAVPGDVLLLEAGDIVAADAKLFEINALAVSEAALTGESLPVEKNLADTTGALLADRKNCVFMGTTVAAGMGRAEITETGMSTELGKIAHLLGTVESGPTPLQTKLEKAGHTLFYLCMAIVAVVGALGLMRGESWSNMVIAAVALAVAAVPEGLTTIVTLALALGVRRMVERHVLVRKLPSVETLGCTTVICTDKTGTLTQGKMAVREVWGKDPHKALFAATACSDAEISESGESGDTTEIAILREAKTKEIFKASIEANAPRSKIFPFDSTRKMMSILRGQNLYSKGAIEAILPLCVAGTEGAETATHEMAARGLRVLAIAMRSDCGEPTAVKEEKLILVGLIGLADPPRPEAIEAIREAHNAGIKVVMITGDHPVTATAIAREMGLLREGDDPAEYVHARVTSEQKLEIVRYWKNRGEIVAMTGDGVNDAPAIKEADIGIAMGIAGTEVTKEASAMILTDDNFRSIISAVEEGRNIFDNIRKTLVYLLSGNFGELMLMLGAGLAGLPVPLVPLQLLWINIVTDSFPALALVTDKASEDNMLKPPRNPAEPILSRKQWITIITTGLLQTSLSLTTFVYVYHKYGIDEARNFVFAVIVFFEVIRAFSFRSETKTIFELGFFSNKFLLLVVLITIIAQMLLHEFDLTRRLFQFNHMSWWDCLYWLGLATVPVTLLELIKVIRRKPPPRPLSQAA